MLCKTVNVDLQNENKSNKEADCGLQSFIWWNRRGKNIKAFEDENPYGLFERNTEIYAASDLFFYSREYSETLHLHDKEQVDCGSFFWRYSGKDLLNLIDKERWKIIGDETIDPGKEYGIVCIELIMNAYWP